MARKAKKNAKKRRVHSAGGERQKKVHVVRTFARAVKVHHSATTNDSTFSQCSIGLVVFVAIAMTACLPISRVAAWGTYGKNQRDAMFPNDDVDDGTQSFIGVFSMTLICILPIVAIIMCCIQYHNCCPNDVVCNKVSPNCRSCCFGQEEPLDDYPRSGLCKLTFCCADCEDVGCTPRGRCKESCCCTPPPTKPQNQFAQYMAFTMALVQLLQIITGAFMYVGTGSAHSAVTGALSGIAAFFQIFVVWWLRPWSTPGATQLRCSIGFVGTVLAFLIAQQSYFHTATRADITPGWQDRAPFKYTRYYTRDGDDDYSYTYTYYNVQTSSCGYSYGSYSSSQDDDSYFIGSRFCGFKQYFGAVHVIHWITILISTLLIFTLSRLLRGANAGAAKSLHDTLAPYGSPFSLEDVEVYSDLADAVGAGKTKKSKGQNQNQIQEREANEQAGKGYVTDKEHKKMLGIAEKGDPTGVFKKIVADKGRHPLPYRGLMTMRTDDGFEDNLAVVLISEGHADLAKLFGGWLEIWMREEANNTRADARRLAESKRKADDLNKLKQQYRNIGKAKTATSTSITGDQIKQAHETRELRKAKALEEATTIVVADEVRYQQEWFAFMKTDSAVDERADFNSFADPLGDECPTKKPQQPKVKDINAKKDNEKYVVGLRLMIRLYLGQVDDALQEVAGTTGAAFKKGPNKDNSRIFEKAKVYKGDIRRVTDYFRRSLVCSSFAVMQAALEILAEHELFTIIRIKNRFSMVNDTAKDTAGYRDCQLLVSVGPEKVLLEVQLHLAPIFALKSDVSEDIGIDGTTGHERYIKFRTLKEKADML